MNHAPDVICAPATPEGTSALAVIRMSGRGSFRILESLMSLEPGRLEGMRRKLGQVKSKGKILDSVVALSWPADRSYTGEEMVEITCHGVPAILRDILDALIEHGARRAEPGEFTRRAFLNGKLSAMDVMALAGTWESGSGAEELSGKIRHEVRNLSELLSVVEEILEGDIEFEERFPDSGGGSIEAAAGEFLKAAEALRGMTAILEGRIRVLIMGPVNSGKSTLFNLLAGTETALISEAPGTTRDGASARITVRGRELLLCDTAGTGGTGIDREASKLVLESIGCWDRIAWLSPSGRTPPPDSLKCGAMEVILVSSRSDEYPGTDDEDWLSMSARTGEGLDRFMELISGAPGNTSLEGISNRLLNLARGVSEHISQGEYDMAAILLSEARAELKVILDEGDGFNLSVERALSRMCVGK